MDTLGQTALHRAALAGHIQTCKLLLSYGADPSIVSLQGFTAAQMGNEAVQQILNGTDCLTWSGFRFEGCIRVHRCFNLFNLSTFQTVLAAFRRAKKTSSL